FAAGVAAADELTVVLGHQQGDLRVVEHGADLDRIGAVPVHEMRLGGPSALAPVGSLDEVDELGHVVVGSLAQDGSGVRGGGGALGGHEESLPVSGSSASGRCPWGAWGVSGGRA